MKEFRKMWIAKGSEENMFILTSIRSEQISSSEIILASLLLIPSSNLLNSMRLIGRLLKLTLLQQMWKVPGQSSS